MIGFYDNNVEKFWGVISEEIEWIWKPKQILDNSDKQFPKWFADGRLNLAQNAIFRHLKK